MIDPALREALVGFDDAALATLANPGLVRRAHRDVEEGKLRLLPGSTGKAVVEADGQRVEIDARGPGAADCACRSVAICRHRIAATIFILSHEGVETGDSTETAADDAPPVDGADFVASIDIARLEKWAGKAGWRAAAEVAGTVTAVEPSPNGIAVSFPDIDGPVRILRGQGFDGIVSKASKSRLKAYHAAAVLAVLRHFGQSVPDAGEEVEQAAAVVEIDPAFLARIAASLGEVAALGMNLAPLPLEEALFELSVSSRADSLPRLAALLRAVAAQMRLRRARALDFDPDRMLELAATAFALVRALAGSNPERRIALAGKVRRDFAPSEPLQLVGCGGERWTTTSGARGVTAWFIEPATGRWLSTSLARGAGQDPTFAPTEAWRNQPLWQSEPLAVLAHARIALEGSRRSADNRLSAPASARATIVARDVRADPHWPGVLDDWDGLARNWIDQVGSGLDGSETPTACLIAPTRIAPPYFDDLAQQLVWPVQDSRGQWLALTIDHEEPVSTAIEALEATVRSGWQGMILVRMEREGDRLALRPVTLFGDGDPVDLSLWSRPWRAGGERSAVRDWLARLRPAAGRRFVAVPRSGTAAALAQAWRHLLDRAEVGPSLAGSLDGDRAALVQRLEAYGLPQLAARLDQGGAGEELLAAAYALLLARQQRCAVPLLQ